MSLIRSKILKSILVVMVLSVLVVVTGLVPIDLSFTKDALGRYAKEKLNADFIIHGPIRLRLGPNARLEATALEVRKAGVEDEVLAQVTALSVSPNLFALLRGDLHLRSIQIDGIRIDYCAALPSIGSAGVAEEPSPPTNRTTSIAADSLVVTSVEIYCSDQLVEHSPEIRIDEAHGSASAEEAISFDVNGRVNNSPFQIEAHGGNLNTMLESLDGFPLRVVATVEGATFLLTGEIDESLRESEFNAQVDLSVKEPRDILVNLGIDIPEVEDFEVSAQVRLTKESAHIENFEARIGKSDIEGTAVAQFLSERNYFEVDTHVVQLDLESFSSSSGQADVTDDLESMEFQSLFDNLRSFDGQAHVVVDQLIGGEIQLDGVELDVSLNDGSLNVSSSAKYFMGGSIGAEAGLDLRSECEQFNVNARASGIDLRLLTELVSDEIPASGDLGEFEVRTESCGSTLAAHRNSTRVEVGVSETSIRYQDIETLIFLDKLKLDAGWSQPSHVTLVGQFLDEKVLIKTKGGTIQELAAGQSWPINVNLRGAGADVSFDGKAAVGDSGFVDVRMKIDAPRVGALHGLIDIESTSELPLSASSVIRWSADDISVDDISVSLGQSVLNGQITSVVEDHEAVLVTNLRSARLDVTELEGLLAPTDSTALSSPQSGPVIQKSDQFMSDFGLNLPSVNLDLTIDEISGAPFEIRDIEVHGRVRNQFIADANLKIRIDDVLLDGTFDLDFRELPGTLSYHTTVANLDIGGILQDLDVGDGADIRAESLTIDYASGGTSLREIAVNGEMRVEINNLIWARKGQDDATGFDLHLAEVEMIAAPDRAIVWYTQGTLDGIPLTVRAETHPLGEILDGNMTTQFSVAASSGNNVGVLSGAVDWSNPDMFSAELVLSGQLMDPETTDLALLKPPLKGLTISTDLTISDREISATNLSAKLHESYATGYAKVRQTELGKELEVRLQAPHVQTLNLIALLNAFRDDQPDSSNGEPSGKAEKRDIVEVIRKFVDAQTLDRHLDVQIGVDEVYAGDYFMGGAQIGLLADSDNFMLRPFSVSLPSGDINVEYVVERVAEGFASHLDMYIERLQYGDVVQLLDADAPKAMRGLLYLDTALTSSAPTVPELVNALQGKVELLVIPENIEAGVVDLWAANLVVALIAPTDSSQPKKLNCVVAGFSVDEGVMKSKNVLLDSTDVIVRGKGEIDIANRTIHMVAAPQAKREKLLSMSTPIAVTGPWNDLQIGVGGAGFVGTMFRWYMALIYVPYKWITGERFPADGLETCYGATDWELE